MWKEWNQIPALLNNNGSVFYPQEEAYEGTEQLCQGAEAHKHLQQFEKDKSIKYPEHKQHESKWHLIENKRRSRKALQLEGRKAQTRLKKKACFYESEHTCKTRDTENDLRNDGNWGI